MNGTPRPKTVFANTTRGAVVPGSDGRTRAERLDVVAGRLVNLPSEGSEPVSEETQLQDIDRDIPTPVGR